MYVQYLVSISVILTLMVLVSSDTHTEECFLQPSELGPDWYKVPRPPQAGRSQEEISYMHMPCAATTVFDVGICACTNLMSYLYESMRRGKTGKNKQQTKGKVKKNDAVKKIVEWEGVQPNNKHSGSLLINIRTGEIKNCPFRASTRGRKWYLIREHGDHWTHMNCAEGTIYDTIKCTCVHKPMRTNEQHKGEEEDNEVFVIQDGFINKNKDETISESLGIQFSDIDFAKESKNNDIPFWRRETLNLSEDNNERSRFKGKSDVRVTLDEESKKIDNSLNKKIFDPTGHNVISDEHTNLLIRSRERPVIPIAQKISPLVIDRKNLPDFTKIDSAKSASDNKTVTTETYKSDNRIKRVQQKDHNNKALMKTKNSEHENVKSHAFADTSDILHVLDTVNSQIVKLENVGRDDLIYDENSSINIPTYDEVKMDNSREDMEPAIYDEIFYQEECSKKPIPELGPQYFLFYVLDLGFVPYTCHGNSIYDDSVCACMPSPEDTAYDEVKFPEEECTKRPIPEMGPQFFEDFLFGIGYIPFVCHGDRFYDNAECACV
ncbi:hypothetical protein ACF0H5_010642 [Mactra antiquata]